MKAGCSIACGKTRYPDKRAAVSQINLNRPNRGRRGRAETLRAYHCEQCGGWHLTKQPLYEHEANA